MLFAIIRLAFWGIAFIISFFLIKKSHSIYKRRCYVIAFVAAVILTTISALIPIENAFITFSSPESAYNYNNSGNVTLIVNGKKTDLVVGTKDDTDVYVIVPKLNDGWKMGMGVDTKQIAQSISNGITIYVYQYKSTSEYYITVFDTSGGPLDITDNYNSEFKYLAKSNSTLNKTFYTYLAYIDSLDDKYTLIVNDKPIKIQD